MDKKGQGWSFDVIVGSVIFMMGFFIFFLYSINFSQDNEGAVESLAYQGSLVADDLLSEGFPTDWTQSNVQKIGIVTDGKIDMLKLENFLSLVDSNYESTKVIFGITKDYYVVFSQPITLDGQDIYGIGLEPSNHKNLMKITRAVILNNKLASMEVEIWE